MSRRFAPLAAALSLAAGLGACTVHKLGLEETTEIDTGDTAAGLDSGDTGETGETGETAPPPVAVGLAGRTWRVARGTLAVARPAGLDELVRTGLDRDLLVYAREETTTSLELMATVAGASGSQNTCEEVRALPTAAWANPAFSVRGAELEISFRGARATLREVELRAIVSPLAEAWSGGTMRAVLDTREVAATLDAEDPCALVASLGGDCDLCEDGVEACVQLEMSGIEAELLTTPFDPTPDSDAC